MSKKDQLQDRQEELLNEMKKLEKKQKAFKIECSHSKIKDNGSIKLAIEPIANGKYRCKRCGAEFSMDIIDQHELAQASTVVHNALQQVRSLSDPIEDNTFILELGKADYAVENLPLYYSRATSVYGKGGKKKKKNKGGNRMGAYGNALNFLSK